MFWAVLQCVSDVASFGHGFLVLLMRYVSVQSVVETLPLMSQFDLLAVHARWYIRSIWMVDGILTYQYIFELEDFLSS